MKRIEAIQVLVDQTAEFPIVATCAATSRELAHVADRDNHLYLLDSMGLTTSVATGIAMAVAESSVKNVVSLDGDGSMLMNLGATATAGFLRPEGLIVVLLDNASYASTAGIPTYSASMDLGAIAQSCELNVVRADTEESLASALKTCFEETGPHLIHVIIEPGNAPDTGLLLADPVVLANRFERWLEGRIGAAV